MTKNAELRSTLPAFFKDAAHDTESRHRQAVTVTTSDLAQLTRHKDQLQTLPTLPILQVAFPTHSTFIIHISNTKMLACVEWALGFIISEE